MLRLARQEALREEGLPIRARARYTAYDVEVEVSAAALADVAAFPAASVLRADFAPVAHARVRAGSGHRLFFPAPSGDAAA